MTMSLREKKRELLKATIERSAVALVLEHGYQDVTVDMICEASMASQRTFFNYFGSKEAAILGPPPQAPSESVVEGFVRRDGDVLADLTRMMTRILAEHGDVDRELWQDRREIIRQTPELMRAQAERIAAKDTELAEVVKRRLSAHQDAAADDIDRQARLIVSLWWGIARHAMKLWSEDPHQNPQQITDGLLTVLAQIKEA